MKRLILLLLLTSVVWSNPGPDPDDEWALYRMILGTDEVNDPVAQELIEAPIMSRMHEIDQHGIVRYFAGTPKLTRFSHSIGVYALLKRFGAPWEEQIAGLLHDASHTVFSHVGDHVFDHQEHRSKWSYQDTIHLWSIRQQGVDELLGPYGLSSYQILPESPRFCCLEQQLPDLCADRLEYNLHTAWILDILSCHEIEAILDDLAFEDGHWFFSSPSLARKVGMHSLSMTLGFWGPPWNAALYKWTALALHRAVELGLFSFDTIHFSTDTEVLGILAQSDDPTLQWYCSLLENPRDHFQLCEPEESDWEVVQKFRGIDPLVATDAGLVRVSDIDPMYRQMFLHVQDVCAKGWHIRWTDDFASELVDLGKEDQSARFALLELQRSGQDIEQEVATLAQGDRMRAERLKAIISLIGWPTKSRVGAVASQSAWLIAQHADHDPKFQYHALSLMEPLLESHEVDSEHVALLTDRVRVARGQPQLYGTHHKAKVADPLTLSERRKAMGLTPQSDYVQELEEYYFGKK